MDGAASVLNHLGTIGVNDDRTADFDRGIGNHGGVKPLDRIALDADVGIHQEHEPARRLGDANVPARARAGIRVQPADACPRPVAREPRGSAIRTRHVDDRDSVGRAAGVGKRGEGRREDGEVVVRDDCDIDVGGKGSR